MPASATMSSGAEMRYVAAQLRKAAARDLERELRGGQRKAFAPLQQEIKAEAAASLPHRGGYAALMAKAVKVSVTVRGKADPVVVARVYARGKIEHRDVVSINAGRLRHPRFGRRDKGFWHDTRVRPGFVVRPMNRVADRVLNESADAAGRVMQKIARS